MTPTLNSFILSLLAGGFVVIAIVVALVLVSVNDPISRS
nr:photosystem II protein X [Meringosphaera mediterranea]WLD06327.1 photosystem II protein X [Meringosphaera mediterranea]